MNYTPPTAAEVRALLARWGLTGEQAGEQAGVSARQIRRYVQGVQRMPYAVLFTLARKNARVNVPIDNWRAKLG